MWGQGSGKVDKTDEDRHVDRMRWGFIGLVIGSLCAYYAVVAPGRIVIRRPGDPGYGEDLEEDEDEDDGEVIMVQDHDEEM